MFSQSPDSSILPPLYARWIEQLLQATIPDETEATCLDCAMCTTKSMERTESDHLFHGKTKCCTYFPAVPNFLTGKILQDQDPSFSAGRLRFLGQLFMFTVITPLGVRPPPAESARYGPFQKDFGQNPDLRCPYFIEEGGLCGIWKYRNANCSTWFCKHVRGRTGLHFWRALKDLLHKVEEKLTVWCIHQLTAGDDDFRQLFQLQDSDLETFQKQQSFYYDISKSENESLQRQVWGKWFGAERSYFEECSRIVDALNWNEVSEIGGPEVSRAAGHLTDCFEKLTGSMVPNCLKAVDIHSVYLSSGKVRAWGYSSYDPIDLPRPIFDALNVFDGSPTVTVLKRLHLERGLRITDEWMKKLCDFGILCAI